MQRIAQSLVTALACLLLSPLISPAALGQTDLSGAGSRHTGGEPSVLSVLTLAKDVVESGRNEAIRLPLRNDLAESMRKTGQESAFGDYVVDALNAWEAWDLPRASPLRKAVRTNHAIRAEARRAFLGGDPESARHLLRDCQHVVFIVGYCASTDAAINSQFLQWELETGDLPAALGRFRQTDKGTNAHIHEAGRVAEALIKAGRRDEGLEILSELRANPLLDKALIAEIYWRLGAVEEGKNLMRLAVRAAIDKDERDSRKRSPVTMAGVQLAMGDRDGGIEALRRIAQLGADHPVLHAPLAGRFAFAGLDADAFSLLDGTPADRATLANIVIGQARRGDFDAAFITLQKLRKLPFATGEDYVGEAVASIARNAARAGDADAFQRADAIRRELRVGPCVIVVSTVKPPQVLEEDSDTQSLGALARAGKARFAIDYALALPDLSKKVEGLSLIAEALAGLLDTSYDPLGFR